MPTSPPPSRAPTRALALGYLVGLFVLAGLALGSYLVLERDLEAHQRLAQLVVIAGRQRVRPAVATSLASRLHATPADQRPAIRADLRGLADAIVEDGAAKELAYWELTPSGLTEAEARFADMARRLADMPDEALQSEEAGHGLAALMTASSDLIARYEQRAAIAGARAESRLERLARWQLALMMGSLSVLALLALLVFRPLLRRVRAEIDALTEAELRARTVIAATGDALLMFDGRGIVREINPAGEQLLGWTAVEVEGRPLRDVLPELADVSIVDAPHGGGAFREMPLQTRTGGALHADVTVTPLRLSGEPLFLAVLHDVTALRRGEQDLRRRLDELQAFYELSEAANSADTIETTYAKALAGLTRAMGADRASLLLFDSDGVLRFKAWRGLSETYRRAVEGHTPWTPDEVDPPPILVADVESVAEMAAYLPAFRAEGIRALGFFPLTHEGRLIGKVMVYFAQPHLFTEEDVRLAQAIAGHVALAVGRRRAAAELRQSEERFRFALAAANMGAWDWDLETGAMSWSESLGPLHGMEAGAFRGTYEAFLDCVHPDDRAFVAAQVAHAIETGEDMRFEYRVRDTGAGPRWMEARGRVVYDGAGRAVRMNGTDIDITERKTAELRLHEEARLIATLNRIGRTLAGELDLDRLLGAVTDEATILTGADLGAFVSRPAGGDAATVTLAAGSRAEPGSYEVSPAAAFAAPILRGERVVRVDDVTEDPALAADPAFRPAEGRPPIRAFLAVPVVSRSGETVGCLVFGHSSPAAFTERHEDVAAGIARWAALALDNASLYRKAVEAEEAQRRQLEFTRAVTDYLAEGVFCIDLDARITFINPAAQRLVGRAEDEVVGFDLHEVTGHCRSDGTPMPTAECPALSVLRTGQTWRSAGETFRRKNGRTFPVEMAASPIVTRGQVTGAVFAFDDISERVRAQQAERFLVEASTALVDSLDHETTLASVVKLAVPRLGDWCHVDMLGEDGALQRIVSMHADPSLVARSDELRRRHPPRLDAPFGPGAVIRTGRSEFYPTIPDALLEQAAGDDEHLALLRESQLTSAIIVPLTARGRVLGAMTFLTAESRRTFDEHDLHVAEELARRAALAVDNARLHGETRQALRMHRQIEEQLGLLVEASGAILGTPRLSEVLPAVIRLAQRMVTADAHALWRRDDAGWKIVASAGLSGAFVDQPVDRPMAPRTVVLEDLSAEADLGPRHASYVDEGIVSGLFVPLRAGGATIGSIAFYFRTRHVFGESETRVATALANLAASALSSAELYERQSSLRHDAEIARERYRTLVHSLDAIVWEAEPSTGRFTFVSQRATSLLGLDPEAWADEPEILARIAHPGEREQVLMLWRRFVDEGRDADIEFRAMGPGGALWLRNIMRAVRDADGGIVQLRGLILDVTARRLAEMASQLSDARTRAILEAAVDAIVTFDERGTIEVLNAAAERMFGWSAAEITGRDVHAIIPVEAGIVSFAGARSAEATGLRRDGSRFPAELSVSEVRLGDRVSFTVIVRDVTARRAAEDALRRAHADLAQKAGELEEANRELSQYAYVVSHDLKTPLRAVHNYADFLRDDLVGRLEGEQLEYLDGLGKAVRQAEELVDDLLDLSRVGSRAVREERIELGAYLRELVGTLAVDPASVVEVAEGEWPTLAADPTLLKQIFQNLVLNGLKFNTSEVRRVSLSWQPAGPDACEVVVADNGIGIDTRHHEQIFGVFQRLHTQREYEGTGIGLAIVRKAAARLGGAVRLESEPGKGSTFRVLLPLRPHAREDVALALEEHAASE